jgi:hypothetical protein
MYFLQGSLHWSKGGGFAPDPHDISRKLFRKFCTEYVLRESLYVFVQDCQMYPIVGSLGSYFRSSVKNMFCERRWRCICTGLSDVSKC